MIRFTHPRSINLEETKLIARDEFDGMLVRADSIVEEPLRFYDTTSQVYIA